MKKRFKLAVLISAGFAAAAQAASFDCAKAITKVEKMICADVEISSLDEQLAQEYKNALDNAKDKDALKKEQVEWLKMRNACKDEACVKMQQRIRIGSLKDSVVEKKYEAITKLSIGKDANGKEIFEQRRGVDDVDIQACQAITDNINAMQKYNVDWGCDFPISSNSYLLSKPQWFEVVGSEKVNALASIHQQVDNRPVYSIVYNLDSNIPDEKIYLLPLISKNWGCKYGNQEFRSAIWFAESTGMTLEKRFGKGIEMEMINIDVIIYASRVYFIAYGSDAEKPKEFWVTTVKSDKKHITNRTV